MSLPHAILALLENEDASGYDLARHFAQCGGHVWSATHQQIYLELGKLHQSGWVEYETVSQDNKPDKKVYSITESGVKELIRWLQRPAAPKRVREAMLIKVLGSHLVPGELVQDELQRQREENEEILLRFREMEAEFTSPASLTGSRRSAYIALRRGILDREAWLTWADEAQRMLQEETPSPVFEQG